VLKETGNVSDMLPMDMTLDLIRDFQRMYAQALSQPIPNKAKAKRYLGLARRGIKSAAPYILDHDFLRRLRADPPMSEAEWEAYRNGPAWPPFMTTP
jgi:hypothetical protein